MTSLPPRMRLRMVRTALPSVLAKLAAIAFAVLVVGIVAIANRGGHVYFWILVYQVPGGDKLGHLLLIGMLSLLVNLGFPRALDLGRVSPFVGSMLIAALITLEESSQIWTPSRTFDVGDLAANYAGILLLGEGVARLIRRRRA